MSAVASGFGGGGHRLAAGYSTTGSADDVVHRCGRHLADRPASGVRRITQLAFPALGVLAAEPVYLLFDIAVVGRLGALALAGLAIGAWCSARLVPS